MEINYREVNKLENFLPIQHKYHVIKIKITVIENVTLIFFYYIILFIKIISDTYIVRQKCSHFAHKVIIKKIRKLIKMCLRKFIFRYIII